MIELRDDFAFVCVLCNLRNSKGSITSRNEILGCGGGRFFAELPFIIGHFEYLLSNKSCHTNEEDGNCYHWNKVSDSDRAIWIVSV